MDALARFRLGPTGAQLERRRETPIGQDLQDYTRFTGFLHFLNLLRPITPLPNQQALFTTKKFC